MQTVETVVVDADGLIALANSDDAHAEKATQIVAVLRDRAALLIYPATSVAEAVTTMQRKYNRPRVAQQIINLMLVKQFKIHSVDEVVIRESISYFRPLSDSKKHTFFDAVVAAIAKNLRATYIFSFDKWYKKLGFKLAEELL